MPKFNADKEHRPAGQHDHLLFEKDKCDHGFEHNKHNLRNLINSCFHAKLYEDKAITREEKAMEEGAFKPKLKNVYNPFKKKYRALLEALAAKARLREGDKGDVNTAFRIH
jgi:hypothetical protein